MSLLDRLRGRRKDDDEPVDPNARSPKLGIKFKDLGLLAQLANQGADLSRPRHVAYYTYFKSREAAQAGAVEARVAGYSCEVPDPMAEYPGQWSLVCERHDAILDPPSVIAADNLFQGIADRAGAEYDGWEASAKP